MENQLNIRVSKLTENQIDQLVSITGMSQTELVSNAIDRMYRQEFSTEALARAIYEEVYPTVDDKYFRRKKVSEINDWLSDGDNDFNRSVLSFAEEWREYDIPAETDEPS